jgi:hypothetical protein
LAAAAGALTALWIGAFGAAPNPLLIPLLALLLIRRVPPLQAVLALAPALLIEAAWTRISPAVLLLPLAAGIVPLLLSEASLRAGPAFRTATLLGAALALAVMRLLLRGNFTDALLAFVLPAALWFVGEIAHGMMRPDPRDAWRASS